MDMTIAVYLSHFKSHPTQSS